ncbi:MAG: hypothetical protein ACI4ED_04860, partial [Suilimivivens sp.]
MEELKTAEYEDARLTADTAALAELRKDFESRGYEVKIEDGKLTATLAGWTDTDSGSLAADPTIGLKVKGADGAEYTIKSIDGENLVLIDASGNEWTATWEKHDSDPITQEQYDLLSEEEQAKYIIASESESVAQRYLWIEGIGTDDKLYTSYGRGKKLVEYDGNDTKIVGGIEYVWESSVNAYVKVIAKQFIEPNTIVNIDNASNYNIIALNDCYNNGHINGSIYVGGTYTGNQFVDDDACDADGNHSNSYINDNQSTTSFKSYTDSKEQAQDSYIQLSDEDVSNTEQYWKQYTQLVLDICEKGYTPNAPSNVTIVDLGKLNVYDFWKYGITIGSDGSYILNQNYTSGRYGEVLSSNASKVMFVTNEECTINVSGLTGIVLAPNANINITTNREGEFAGTVIGKNVTNSFGAEGHLAMIDLVGQEKTIIEKTRTYKTEIRTWNGSFEHEDDIQEVSKYLVNASALNKEESRYLVN